MKINKSLIDVLTAITVLAFALVISLAINYPLMLLWNWLMPKLFHLPELTFWQMCGLSVLISVFGNMIGKRNNNKR